MPVLTFVFQASLVGAAAAIVIAFGFPRYRRKAFFVAAGFFAVCMVLGILSIGIVFAAPALASLVAGILSKGPPQQSSPSRDPDLFQS